MKVSLIDYSKVSDEGSGKFRIESWNRILNEEGELVPLEYRVDKRTPINLDCEVKIRYGDGLGKDKYGSCHEQRYKEADNNPNSWEDDEKEDNKIKPEYERNWIISPTEV